MPTMGETIKHARERLRMTQRQLADAVGVNVKTVDNWENGRTSPKNRIGALEEALGVRLRGGQPVERDHRSPREMQLDNFRRLAELAAERGDTELAARLLRIAGDPVRAEMLEKFTRSIDPGDNSQAS